MHTDANLYPHHKTKAIPREISTSSSLAFTSTLNSLLTKPSSTSTAPGRPRPSKSKADIFSAHNKNSKKRAAKDLEEDEEDNRGRRRTGKQDIGGVDDAVLHRSKRKMEEKVKTYNRMKRGALEEEEDGDNRLVDFDRKWAEGETKRDGHNADFDSDLESDDGQGEMVDYEDEYGRARRGTRAEAERVERKRRNQALGAEELYRMSARPAMPQNLIYGDTVQTLAFNPEEETHTKMEALAKKRDRSLTPPEQKHYEADKEFRIKGVGFYGFSKDESLREKEMKELAREREETERIRKEREEKKEARKREIEERRKEIGERRAKKLADSFLDDLGGSLGDGNDERDMVK